ncbi:MAG: DUF805 domain-containing protein [Rhizobiales bacterium]|nr:DUF805 domain-containing protein [Hyphomicrobiales bacterium]
MRGVIVAVAPDGTYGQLSAEDGQRYSYWTKEVRNGQAQPGLTVEFQMWEGQPIDIFVVQAPPQRTAPRPAPPPLTATRAAPSPYAAAQPSPYAAAQSAYPAAAAAPVARAGFPPSQYWIKLFTSPSGRISRRQFWLHGVLPIVVGNIVLGWIPILGQLVSLVLLWGTICIGFKRFHDLGYPGWYSLLYLVPMVAGVVIFSLGLFMTSFVNMAWLLAEILWGIAFLIGLAQLIFVYIRVGQEGPNQYGPDPLAN